MNWQTHTDAIITKASSRLYFLKILKKSGLPHQLWHFYLSVIRPILKYCSAIWHHGLTKAQAESLEAIQRRALRIIDSSTVSMPYEVALSLTQFASLHDRRGHFNKITKKNQLHNSPLFLSLWPPPTTQRLHYHLQTTYPSLYPRPATHTKHYISFIHHTLLNYQ